MQEAIPDKETLKFPVLRGNKEIVTDLADTPKTAISWLEAFKQITPIYIATHIIFLALTYLATLFRLDNFSSKALPLRVLLYSWYRWDSSQFTHIARFGYDAFYHMAFFPLFPLLERGLALAVGDPFIAGLLISNGATLGLFMVMYKLVAEDFDTERAWRSVLYLAVFPTAFFFAAAYNESLFLLFALLSFYWMRKGRWWLAALAALFASLTRSIAVCLFVPFAYEYLRQREFQWRRIGPSVLSCVGMIGGVVIFMVYGYIAFHDPLAFSHAETGGSWQRHLTFPWTIFTQAAHIIFSTAFLTFKSIHTVIDLSAILLILVTLVLAFTGPWKLAREHWSYALYAVTIYLFVILVPEGGGYPLSSLGRFMLEIFPAFVLLATIGQRRSFNLYYLSISVSLLSFMLLQWLTGGWIV